MYCKLLIGPKVRQISSPWNHEKSDQLFNTRRLSRRQRISAASATMILGRPIEYMVDIITKNRLNHDDAKLNRSV